MQSVKVKLVMCDLCHSLFPYDDMLDVLDHLGYPVLRLCSKCHDSAR